MICVREMTESDVPAVAAIEKATFSMPWSADDFRRMIADANMTYMVITVDDIIVGGAGFHNILGDGEITNVAVLEAYRGNGYGRRLLEALLEKGYQMGAENFTLEVRVSNTPAIRLYESLGFVSEGIRPRFYERPVEDAVIYWKRG